MYYLFFVCFVLYFSYSSIQSFNFFVLRVIFNSFSDPDPVKKDNAVGIQLLGVVVANGLFPVTSDSRIDEDR